MPHVVTQSCCADASCVYACPVNCIHPTPDEPDFLTAEMLHIDPAACVDCGACVSACPVDAIVPHRKLAETQVGYLQINADYFREPHAERATIGGTDTRPALARFTEPPRVGRDREPLRVAIVGSGPAAMYAADELLTQPGVRVNVFDRLPVPHGLVRSGVAPDHQQTKRIGRLYDRIAEQSGFEYHLNVEVGEHLTHEEVLAHHHAVIYAVGAATDRALDIPGEGLPGVDSATNFVAWYNGHPDHADRTFDLSHERAVIVGNGNVALDVARILTVDPDRLADTDIAENAWEALRHSKVREVLVVARRGFAQSAFTTGEFAGLIGRTDVDVTARPEELALDPVSEALLAGGDLDHATVQKVRLLGALRAPTDGRRRIALRYLLTPTEILGTDGALTIGFARNRFDVGADGAVRIVSTGEREVVGAGLVLTSIGYRGVPVAGVPFDDERGVIPNEHGRVSGATGVYATGWIKRGPSGFIGTNKTCAQDTVRSLVDDFNAGVLRAPAGTDDGLRRLVRQRQPAVIDRAGWLAIDREEIRRGGVRGAARVKITDEAELVSIASDATGDVVPTSGVRRMFPFGRARDYTSWG